MTYPTPQPQFAEPGVTPPAPALQFQDPSGGGVAPSARHLEGRTIVIVPRRVDESTKFQGADRPTAYLDLYVLDGGPMVYGDSEDKANPRPPTHRIETPAFFENVTMGNTMIVSEVRAKLGADGRPTGLALGVVQRGNRGNRPYMLTKCEKDLDGNVRPDGAQRRELAMQVYQAHTAGAWQSPKAQPLAVAAAMPTAQVNYGQPPAQPQGWPAHPGPAVPDAAHYAPAPVPQPQPVPAPAAGMPAPPSWAHVPDQWARLTPEQQQGVWAQQGAPASTPAPVTVPAPASAPPSPAGGPGW